MSDPILADPISTNRSRADLRCPQLICQAPLAWARDPPQLVCERCGWTAHLTAVHQADILDALAGITELNLPAYLRILDVAARPASGERNPR